MTEQELIERIAREMFIYKYPQYKTWFWRAIVKEHPVFAHDYLELAKGIHALELEWQKQQNQTDWVQFAKNWLMENGNAEQPKVN